ncbi:TIGR03089 family protein [Nocardioides ferulae]|uniref:TIGR03089 family protein n=1 Tax=Nocardioides ferulae TaxID=2340821 RepID=UPI000EB155A2|nr:TIGR03089 family protein [Nocardioides ferulae]
MHPTPTTFPDLLTALLRSDAGRPLVTFYDHATDERVELSVTTYANWVAKAASLLAEEHGLERGDRLRIDLPPHWLGAVFLGAAWQVGLALTWADDADAVVCGPDALAQWSTNAARLPVLACSLRPLGVRFAAPLPAGVHDVGLEVWSQPDSFIPWDPPQPDDVAVELPEGALSQEELWRTAAAGSALTDGGRLLSEANPASPPGLASFTEPLARGGSLVLVRHAERERLEATYASERATARFPA